MQQNIRNKRVVTSLTLTKKHMILFGQDYQNHRCIPVSSRESARAIVPTIISQGLREGTVRLGNLHPTRDMNYVSNTVDGFVRAASCSGALGCTINLGSGREISMEDLVRMIGSLIGRGIEIQTEKERQRPDKSEVERLLADNTLARETLGWEPSVTLEEGLRVTIEWMRKHLDGYPAGTYAI